MWSTRPKNWKELDFYVATVRSSRNSAVRDLDKDSEVVSVEIKSTSENEWTWARKTEPVEQAFCVIVYKTKEEAEKVTYPDTHPGIDELVQVVITPVTLGPKVFVNWDPGLERVLCVHTTEDGECDVCRECNEIAKKQRCYYVEGSWFEVLDP